MFGGKRWCFMTCTLFTVCPRILNVAASVSHEWSNSNKVPSMKSLSAHSKSSIPGLSLNLLTDKGSSLSLQDVEPGFDFNDEEMKRLKIWPGGAIPYYIDEFSFDKVFRDRIRNFLEGTNSMTGLNFLELHRPPGDDETRWVFFINRQGVLRCVDHPFKNFTSTGVQKILLGYDCLGNSGELAEAVLALVGIPPQHNAPDRNKYIEIVKENIMPGKAYLFDILLNTEWLFHGIDYDFASASHYNLHKYTKNGKATIKPRNAVRGISIGEGNGFSYTDVWKIRMIYNYISKKRLKSISIPECKKLFNLGSNFNNYVHESEDEVQPRKKPHQYLGLPDESKESPSGNKEINTPNTDKEITQEEVVEETPEKVQDVSKKSDESNEETNNKNVSKNKEKTVFSVENPNEKMLDENSLAQSDFPSDGEGHPHGLKFTRPGHNG